VLFRSVLDGIGHCPADPAGMPVARPGRGSCDTGHDPAAS